MQHLSSGSNLLTSYLGRFPTPHQDQDSNSTPPFLPVYIVNTKTSEPWQDNSKSGNDKLIKENRAQLWTFEIEVCSRMVTSYDTINAMEEFKLITDSQTSETVGFLVTSE